MLAMLDGADATEFPVVIPYMGILLRDHWDETTDVPWWAVRSGNIEARLQVAGDLQAELGVDWVPAERSYPREWRERHEIKLLGGRPFLADRWTGAESEVVREPSGGFQDTRAVNRVSRIEDIDDLVEIRSAEDLIADGSLDYASAVVREFGESLFVVASIDDPFWGMNRCFGLHDMLTNLVEHPDWAERALERNTLASIELVKAYAEVGVDGIWHECTYSSRDMISLAHFSRFAAPYTGRLIRETGAAGMKSILYFCGDPGDRLEDLVGMNPTCIALEEDKKQYGLELGRIDEAVGGRACLLGNVDAVGVLQDGTPEEIGAELDRQFEIGRRNGRFVMSLGSPVTPSTPIARVAEFIELARERSAAG